MENNPTAVSDRTNGPDLRVDSVAPAPAPKGRRSIRDRILGGLLLSMPLLITLWILAWFYSILEQKVIDPLAGMLLWKLKFTTSISPPYWFETYVAPVIAILIALVFLYCLDLLADTRMRRGFGWFLKRVPLFSQIYNPVQQVFQSLEKGPEQQRQQRMVLITFPHPGVKLPAFVTGKCYDVKTGKPVLCVYVPTTPVPTSGFFLLVPEEEVTDLNWNTEQTLQAVMSGGLACPSEVSYFSVKTGANQGEG
jgi:uncharacterized membrane protein